MSLNYKIKIVYDFDEGHYIVFVDGISNIEGYGQTEQDAIQNFKQLLSKELQN